MRPYLQGAHRQVGGTGYGPGWLQSKAESAQHPEREQKKGYWGSEDRRQESCVGTAMSELNLEEPVGPRHVEAAEKACRKERA